MPVPPCIVAELQGGPWLQRFEEIFSKAGMALEDAANKVRVPGHKGPHPEAYHQEVFDRLSRATDKLTGDKYKNALVDELERISKEVVTPGTRLNQLVTGN